MKHIKKKVSESQKLADDVYEYLLNVETSPQDIQELKAGKFDTYNAHAITDTKEWIQCFKYRSNNILLRIPEPNPILIYFSTAQSLLKQLENEKSMALKIIASNNDVGQGLTHFWNFYSSASSFITSLFNSLEAFINLQIPNDFKYHRVTNKSTEVFDKEQIQRYLSFSDKVKRVLPQAKNKSFHRHFAHKFEIIVQLEEFRNDIVHTKADVKSMTTYYENLFVKALDYNYLLAIETVRDYINYYHPDLIEPCDCGRDY